MTTKDPVDKVDVRLPPATLRELVAQSRHRLASLEAELKDKAKSGEVKPRAFARRAKDLEAARQRLAELERRCPVETSDALTASDIGLPLVGDCTPAERAVCATLLAADESELTRLEAETAKVQRWAVEVASGQAGLLRPALIRRRVSRLTAAFDGREEELGAADKSLTEQTDRLLAAACGGARDVAWTTLDSLIELYRRIDGAIGRIARLKAAVKKEAERTRAMRAWLCKEEAALADQDEQVGPPSPLRVALAAGSIGAEATPAAQRQKRRQSLVEQFWDEVVHQGLRAPDSAAVLAEAAALLSRARAEADRAKDAGGLR